MFSEALVRKMIGYGDEAGLIGNKQILFSIKIQLDYFVHPELTNCLKSVDLTFGAPLGNT